MFRTTGNCLIRCVQAFYNALVKAPIATLATGVVGLLGFGLYMASVLAPSGYSSYLVYVGLTIVVGLIALAALWLVASGSRES